MYFISDNYPPTVYTKEITIKIVESLKIIIEKAKRKSCPICGNTLDFDRVDMYDHAAGWEVIPEIEKQWLSVHCGQCGYDVSINKLGVHR